MGFLSAEKLIVGYNLGNEYSQISYSRSETGDVETITQTAGAESYNIPTVLCKRKGVNQWFYGKEALRQAEGQQGILVDNLLALALDGEPVMIEGESFDPVALLTLFFKRSLGMLGQVLPSEKIQVLMITCESLDSRTLSLMNDMVERLHLKAEHVYFQNHGESCYNYMIHQPEELWRQQVLFFSYQANSIRVFRMECNRRTTPMVAFIEEKSHPFPLWEELPEPDAMRERRIRELDSAFLRLAMENCEGNVVSSVFLVGDGFREEWLKESLRYLCRNRRVFQGNNLFSKGACYSAMERLKSSDVGRQYVYLGNDKLKANIGIKLLRQGEESYYALIDAGVNWYEISEKLEFYIQDGNVFQLVITPVIGRTPSVVNIELDDLLGPISRVRASFRLQKENVLEVAVEDLGFGEIRPATEKVWRENIELY